MGFGVHGKNWELRDHVPIYEPQTNNSAQLYAVLRAIQLATQNMVIEMDSEYVYKGLTCCMHRWDETHWVLRSRVLAPADLWKVVLQALPC